MNRHGCKIRFATLAKPLRKIDPEAFLFDSNLREKIKGKQTPIAARIYETRKGLRKLALIFERHVNNWPIDFKTTMASIAFNILMLFVIELCHRHYFLRLLRRNSHRTSAKPFWMATEQEEYRTMLLRLQNQGEEQKLPAGHWPTGSKDSDSGFRIFHEIR